MARLAIIENGYVANIILGEPGFAGGIECADDVGIGWSYDGSNFIPPEPIVLTPPLSAPQPQLVAVALLTIDGPDLNGVDAAAGFAFGMRLDTGLYWLFFSNEMANTSYCYNVQVPEGQAIVNRFTQYMEVVVLKDGEPYDPAELSTQVYRAV